MNLTILKAWFSQATTGTGIAGILGILASVASGQMTWQQAVPMLVAAAILLIYPEGKQMASGGSTLAQDLIQFIPLITAAVEHGKTIAPAPSTPAQPAAPANPPAAA